MRRHASLGGQSHSIGSSQSVKETWSGFCTLGTEVFLVNFHKGLSSCPTPHCLSMRYVGELVWTQKGEVTCLTSHSADRASRTLGFSLSDVPSEDS